MNLANKLTLLRIIMIPIFLYFVYSISSIGLFIAAIVFLLATVTDFLDGYIARSRNQVTVFGKIFDPIADKLLVLSALIPLVELELLAGWVVIIILAREFIVAGFRYAVSAQGGQVIAASIIAKLKTISQDVLVIYLLVSSYIVWMANPIIMWILISISVILTIWSMLDYMISGTKQLKELIKE